MQPHSVNKEVQPSLGKATWHIILSSILILGFATCNILILSGYEETPATEGLRTALTYFSLLDYGYLSFQLTTFGLFKYRMIGQKSFLVLEILTAICLILKLFAFTIYLVLQLDSLVTNNSTDSASRGLEEWGNLYLILNVFVFGILVSLFAILRYCWREPPYSLK